MESEVVKAQRVFGEKKSALDYDFEDSAAHQYMYVDDGGGW